MVTTIRSLTCGIAVLAAAAALAQAALAGEPGFVVKFDPKQGQLPEGVAVHGEKVVVGFAPRQLIAEVTPDGSIKPFAQLPKAPPGKGFLTGMVFDDAGNLYANLVSFVPETKKGIYKVAPDGKVSLLTHDPNFGFVNGIIWRAGQLYVTDSTKGAVYKISARDGKHVTWAQGEALKGDKDACPPAERTFGLGANGLTFGGDGALYVGVTDRGMIARIPVKSDGSAGAPEIFMGPDCAKLEGMDGAATDAKGNVYMTTNQHNKIYRVGLDKTLTAVAEGGILDFPASIAFAGDGTLYVANFALGSVQAKKQDAKPGLLKFKP